ncbi:unnamed protein product, partial [Ceratitis capitata]
MEVFDTCNEENLNESSSDGTLWETLKELCSRVPAYRMFKDVSGPTGTQKIAFEMIIDNVRPAISRPYDIPLCEFVVLELTQPYLDHDRYIKG